MKKPISCDHGALVMACAAHITGDMDINFLILIVNALDRSNVIASENDGSANVTENGKNDSAKVLTRKDILKNFVKTISNDSAQWVGFSGEIAGEPDKFLRLDVLNAYLTLLGKPEEKTTENSEEKKTEKPEKKPDCISASLCFVYDGMESI